MRVTHRANLAVFFCFLLPLAAVAVVWVGAGTDFQKLLEWRSVDLRFKLRGAIPVEKEIAIVAVDEATFSALKLKYPFPPVVYRDLLARLDEGGATVVAFDFLYSEPTRECDPPGQDEILAGAIKASDNVVWAFHFDDGGKEVHPIEIIKDSAVGTGFINLPDERDSRIRRFQVEKAGKLSFAAAAVEAYAGFLPERWRGESLRLIKFRGPADSYPRYSLGDVLTGAIPPEKFRGKICLVGADFAAAHDVYPTPFHSAEKRDMPGIEIHANIIGNILRGDHLVQENPALEWLVMLAICLGIGALLYLGHPWWSLAVWAASSAGWMGYSMLMFLRGGVTLLVAPLLALALTFSTAAYLNYILERDRRREVRELFSSYVDPKIVNLLLKNPASVTLEGQRITATILDTDIEGFTSITERMDPAALVKHLNEYFETITQAAISAGGMHDKFVGDALMVIFGFPISQGDHAVKAVMAAKEMLVRVERLNQKWEQLGLPVFKTRIGICSGEVVIGNVGGTKRKAFTAMGDAANIASRIEGLNKRFGTRVLISESTAKLLPPDIPLRDLGETPVRGISKPIRVFNPTFDVPPSAGYKPTE